MYEIAKTYTARGASGRVAVLEQNERNHQELENCKVAIQEWLIMSAYQYEDHASYDMLHALWLDRICALTRRQGKSARDWREMFAPAGIWLFEEIVQRGCGMPVHFSNLAAERFAQKWGRADWN